jgi:PPE family
VGTDIDYSTVSHETIYQHITGGADSAGLMDASQGWRSVAAKLQDLHGVVEQAIRGISAAQQGAAADAATHATIALMPWLDSSVAAANAMAARIAEQAGSFAHTRNNMPQPVKVPEVSFSQDPGTWMADHAVEWLPGIQTQHERDQVAAQQAEQRARELMTAYQGSSNDNLVVSQEFTAAPAVVADVSDPSLGSGAGAGGPSAYGPAPVSPTHAGVLHTPATPAAPAVAGHAAATVAAAGTAPQPASGSRQAPAASTAPQLAGGCPVLHGEPTAGAGTITPAAAAGFAPTPFRAAGKRPRSTGGEFGPRPTAWLGEESSHRRSAAPVNAEHTGAGRAARGAAGWEGAPLSATGAANRDSHTEHWRPSYLIEHDTNALIGELPPTAPPVIGVDG